MSKNNHLRHFARAMRKDPTPAARILWKLVRNRRLAGYRFRREEEGGAYILDFYCAVARLAIELDGDSHIGREEYDRERDEYLRAQGLHVLRIPNGQVYEEAEAVVELIAQVCAERAAANPKVAHKVDAEGRFRPTPSSWATQKTPHPRRSAATSPQRGEVLGGWLVRIAQEGVNHTTPLPAGERSPQSGFADCGG